MRLDLHKIIEVPGERVTFEDRPDVSDLRFEGVTGYSRALEARGEVVNRAGVLHMNAELRAEMECVCARCLREFRMPYFLRTEAILSAEEPESEDSDIYLLDGDFINTDEVLVTAFVLSQEQRVLCSEDCRGLCPQCGKNLNDGPCECRAETDPRLAVLGQLLEE